MKRCRWPGNLIPSGNKLTVCPRQCTFTIRTRMLFLPTPVILSPGFGMSLPLGSVRLAEGQVGMARRVECPKTPGQGRAQFLVRTSR